jgi:hypothetical protein
MPLTQTQIISQSLTIMGKKPIMNLVNQSDIVTAAVNSWDYLLQSVVSKYFWRFATLIAVLSQNVVPPIGGYWRYSYQLPADFLKLVHLWPQQWDFEIYRNNLLYANFNNQSQPLYLEYQNTPLVETFPPYFQEYFAYEIAAYLALSNAQMPDYYEAIKKERDFQLAVALAADAQNRPQTPLQSAPMLSRRFVTTFASG